MNRNRETRVREKALPLVEQLHVILQAKLPLIFQFRLSSRRCHASIWDRGAPSTVRSHVSTGGSARFTGRWYRNGGRGKLVGQDRVPVQGCGWFSRLPHISHREKSFDIFVKDLCGTDLGLSKTSIARRGHHPTLLNTNADACSGEADNRDSRTRLNALASSLSFAISVAGVRGSPICECYVHKSRTLTWPTILSLSSSLI